MRNLILCSALAVAAGCTAGAKPAAEVAVKYPRLEPGTRGIAAGSMFVAIHKLGSDPASRELLEGQPWYEPDWTRDDPESGNPKVEGGTDLVVVVDDDPPINDRRMVQVKVLGGEWAGKSYLIERHHFAAQLPSR